MLELQTKGGKKDCEYNELFEIEQGIKKALQKMPTSYSDGKYLLGRKLNTCGQIINSWTLNFMLVLSWCGVPVWCA